MIVDSIIVFLVKLWMNRELGFSDEVCDWFFGWGGDSHGCKSLICGVECEERGGYGSLILGTCLV